MGKKIQKDKPQPNSDPQQKKIYKKDIAINVKGMLRKASLKRRSILLAPLKQVLKQSIVQCPICLQTLLRPVLAQCGHAYCLDCAQNLARNGYACGICKDYEARFDLKVNSLTQKLIYIYLEKCSQDEKLNYQERQRIFEQKEASRKIGDDIDTGKYIDYWCTQMKCWRDEFVFAVEKDILILPKYVSVHKFSRRAAKFKTFTGKPSLPKDSLPQNGQRV